MIWNHARIKTAIAVLKTNNSVTEVCRELSATWNEEVSFKALTCAFLRYGYKKPTHYLDPKQERTVPSKWSAKLLKTIIPTLKRYGTVAQACAEISIQVGWNVTATALRKAFMNAGMKTPATYVDPELKSVAWKAQAALGGQRHAKNCNVPQGMSAPAAIRGKGPVGPVASEEEKQEHLEIVRLVQKGKGSVEALADALDCAPKEARRRIDAAAAAGYNVKWHGDSPVFAADRPADHSDALYVPWDGKERCFGVISDSHAGSITHEKEGQIAFINMAHQCGAEEIWHAGDLVEGTYYFRQGQLEQYAIGYEAQSKDALEGLPRLKGLKYRIVAGNHDFTYQREVGLDPVKNMALVHGRDDITPMGYPIGRLVYGDDPENLFKVELAHPKTRPAYAASWPVQKFVERMQGGSKPHILVMGHLHSHLTGDFRSIWCVMPGCWQWATTYESSQGLEPAVGGVLVWVRREGREFKIRHEWHAMRSKPVTWHK